MSQHVIVTRLRLFLLGLAAFMCLGTIGELVLIGHYTELLQLLPFGLCGVGLLVIVAVIARPHRTTIWILRVTMMLVGLGGLFGVFEHIEKNYNFVVEIAPNTALGDLVWKALSGANPLLAPGMLTIAALMTIAATYYHPALGGEEA